MSKLLRKCAQTTSSIYVEVCKVGKLAAGLRHKNKSLADLQPLLSVVLCVLLVQCATTLCNKNAVSIIIFFIIEVFLRRRDFRFYSAAASKNEYEKCRDLLLVF